MTTLRTISARPELVVDQSAAPLSDGIPTAFGGAQAVDVVGPPGVTDVPQEQQALNGPVSRDRIVTALPLNEAETGPVRLAPDTAIVDSDGCFLSDSAYPAFGGALAVDLLGEPTGVVVHRMVYAAPTRDTRRFGGF